MTDIVPLPLPNFLIDPQDGEFTPYDARSLVDPSESSDQSDHQILHTTTSSTEPQPSLRFSPMTSTSRSRATSDALEKLLAIQAQQLSAIGEAWRAKFSLSSPLTATCSEKFNEGGIVDDGHLKADRSLIFSGDESGASRQEKERSWMDETRCSVDSLSDHRSTSVFEATSGEKDDERKVTEDDGFEEGGKEITPITEAELKEWDKELTHLIIDYKTLVLDWLKHLQEESADPLNQTNAEES